MANNIHIGYSTRLNDIGVGLLSKQAVGLTPLRPAKSF